MKTQAKWLASCELLRPCARSTSHSCGRAGTDSVMGNGAPGEPATKPEDEPVLFLHRPGADKANGTAVVICPGGGYGHLAIDYEGHEEAEWFNTMGVTAFVLKYRHNASGHKHPVPMLDGQRALRTVRARASRMGH